MKKPNGYVGSKEMIDDMVAYGNWYKIGDSLAKDLGVWVYIKHLVQSRMRIMYLRLKIRLTR